MATIEVVGLERVLGKLSARLYAGPLRDFLLRSVICIEKRAKENAPVDTGRLRSSIGHRVDGATPPTWGSVGTNVHYAPYMEYGTGALSDGPGGGGRHWPPGDALNTWALRHGFKSGGQVARIIGRRGGLRPRRYLRKALKESLSDIRRFVGRLGEDVGRRWGK